MHAPSLQRVAIDLRSQGYTYKYISNLTGISKSTLSDWLRDISYTPNNETREQLGAARSVALENKATRIQQEKLILKEAAEEKIGEINDRDLFFLGLGLYWGEGSKTHDITRVINSDPKLIQAAIRWFKCLGITTENFFVTLHVYPDSDVDECLQFWSEATTIPISQFGKVQIDKRTDKRNKNAGKLRFGTIQLGVRSMGNKEFGVLLARRIKSEIEVVAEKIIKRV